MAEKAGRVLTMQMDSAKKADSKMTADLKVSSYMEKNRVPIIAVTAFVLTGIVFYVVFSIVLSKASAASLTRIDAISRALTSDSSSLDSAALDLRRGEALESLKPLLKKGGVAGVRANMLAAEVAWQSGDYESAVGYWRSAAAKGKKSYTAPIAMFNEAASAEEKGDLKSAAELYSKAAKTEDFMLRSAALFNLGRVYEGIGDWGKAIEAYNDLMAKSPNDSWAHLAKSRLIAAEIAGKE